MKNKVQAKLKSSCPIRAPQLFSQHTLICHHVIEVFVSKCLHNEIWPIHVPKPGVKTAGKMKVSNLISRCENSFTHGWSFVLIAKTAVWTQPKCFLDFVLLQNVFCTDSKHTKFCTDSKKSNFIDFYSVCKQNYNYFEIIQRYASNWKIFSYLFKIKTINKARLFAFVILRCCKTSKTALTQADRALRITQFYKHGC